MNVETIIRTDLYKEVREHRLLRICWAVFNKFAFPLLHNKLRILVLRLFGAKIAESCHVYGSVKVYAPWRLTLGSWVCIGPRVEIYNKADVRIGSHVVVSQDAYLCTASHDVNSLRMDLVIASVTIGSNAWLAAKSAVLPGVTVGEGAVVGACAVVAKDVPPWSVAVGNPAAVVRCRRVG
jgi:putative colanic acid biosynthesis acetyltransferase WcaF